MDDRQIIELYFQRDPDAIDRSAEKYGRYCGHIARNILNNEQDAEECVNDAWFSAWNSIPPQRPEHLGAYLGKLTRSKAIDRWRAQHRRKRGGSSADLALDELSELLPSGESPEGELMQKRLPGPSIASWPGCRRPSAASFSAAIGISRRSPKSARDLGSAAARSIPCSIGPE